jgi:hypothetical protein
MNATERDLRPAERRIPLPRKRAARWKLWAVTGLLVFVGVWLVAAGVERHETTTIELLTMKMLIRRQWRWYRVPLWKGTEAIDTPLSAALADVGTNTGLHGSQEVFRESMRFGPVPIIPDIISVRVPAGRAAHQVAFSPVIAGGVRRIGPSSVGVLRKALNGALSPTWDIRVVEGEFEHSRQ